MKRKLRRVFSLFVIFAMLLAWLPVSAPVMASYVYAGDIAPQEGVTLHCWNCSFSAIGESAEDIYCASFNGVQTPALAPDYFDADSGEFGTYADFVTLCQKAHEWGIEVFVEVAVADTDASWKDTAEAFLTKCIDGGADGFRINCTDSDSFWPALIPEAVDYAQNKRGINLYCYGGIPEGADASEYTGYMSVTDADWSSKTMSFACTGGYTSYTHSFRQDAYTDQVVIWAESRESYTAETDSSSIYGTERMVKAWALTAGRNGAMSVYLPRSGGTAILDQDDTGLYTKTVKAINEFHNYHVGIYDSYLFAGNTFLLQRGSKGAIVVNLGVGGTSVNGFPTEMSDGTYTDQVSGNTFTVSNGYLSGTISSSGVAVIYDPAACLHKNHDTYGYCPDCSQTVAHESHNRDGCCVVCGLYVGHIYTAGVCACGAENPQYFRTVYFRNTNGWEQPYAYSWSDDTQHLGYWPGTPMEYVGDDVWSIQIPQLAKWIIFNDNQGTQTDDLTVPSEQNCYDWLTGTWSVYGAGGEIPVFKKTVYFRNTRDWEAPYVWSWKNDTATNCFAAWPGEAMTYVAGNVWSIELPLWADMIIFSNSGESQTVDLSLPTDGKNCYDSVTGTWSIYPTEPTLSVTQATLLLKDEVRYKFYFTVEDPDGQTVADGAQMGLVFYTDATGTTLSGTELLGAEGSEGSYSICTDGVAAKNMGDVLYLKLFTTCVDGSRSYSELIEYSAVHYVKSVFENSDDETLKSLCISLLNYGAAAQTYFDYRTGALMNSFLEDSQKALGFTEDMISELPAVEEAKAGTFGLANNGFDQRIASTVLGGALSVNYYFRPDQTPVGEVKLYYWDQASYEAAEVLTAGDNYITMTLQASGHYKASLTGISAKAIGDAIYVAAVYETEDGTCSSGVVAYSISNACRYYMSGEDTALAALAEALAVYGCRAKAFWSN